jgi:hypothetical protein
MLPPRALSIGRLGDEFVDVLFREMGREKAGDGYHSILGQCREKLQTARYALATWSGALPSFAQIRRLTA